MRTSRLLRARVRSRVIVTLHSGEAIAGVLWEADRQAWVLREAQAIGAGEDRGHLPVDGELVLLADQIRYAQVP